MMESLKFLVSSPYIRDLATLVVAYGISINLVEVTWKSKLKAQVSNGEVTYYYYAFILAPNNPFLFNVVP